MKLKMFSMLSLASIFAFIFPFSTAFAGAGEWDNIGTYGMTYQTSTIKSGGGYFYFHNNSQYGHTFTLYEVDESGNPPETVKSSFYVGPNSDSPVINVSNFVDGTNNQAELVLFKGNDTYITVTCYD